MSRVYHSTGLPKELSRGFNAVYVPSLTISLLLFPSAIFIDVDVKRILAIDGGGLRGLVAIRILEKLEAQLRKGTGRPNLVLADVFHLFSGTSTGAIIAASLSKGMAVSDGLEFFQHYAPNVFKPSMRHFGAARFDNLYLSDRLKELYGASTPLGSPKLRTLLLITLFNASTDSPWFLSNSSASKFNQLSQDGSNLKIPLWKAVLASASAPTYFPAQSMSYGAEHEAVFLDGALTGFNNPAFKAFLFATTPIYNVGWPTGVKDLLLVSVGTGSPVKADKTLTPSQVNFLYAAQNAPRALIASNDSEQDLMCRMFGDCIAGPEIDLEVGDMIGGGNIAAFYKYARFNALISPISLKRLGLDARQAEKLGRIDDPKVMPLIDEFGMAIANRQIDGALIERLFSDLH